MSTRTDYHHVKLLALIAIVASQVAIFSSRRHTLGERKTYSIYQGQRLFKIDGNPIDGFTTNFVEVVAVTNDWVKIRYQDRADFYLTLQSWVIQNCYNPVQMEKDRP